MENSLYVTDKMLFELETRIRRLEVRKKRQERKESKNFLAFPIPANSASVENALSKRLIR